LRTLPKPVRRSNVGWFHAFLEGHKSRGRRGASLDDPALDRANTDAEFRCELLDWNQNVWRVRAILKRDARQLCLVTLNLAAPGIPALIQYQNIGDCRGHEMPRRETDDEASNALA
jgi:hypothetical protein